MRHALPLSAVALAAVIVLTSCASDQKPAGSAAATGDIHIAHLTVPSGTSIEVVVNTTISSEHAHVGDVWGGSVITGHEGSRPAVPSAGPSPRSSRLAG